MQPLSVSCTAPATENASLQILCQCPTPAIIFWTCYKTLHFRSLLARYRIPYVKPHLNLQKCCGAFNILTLKCASHHNGVHFEHLNFQKCSEPAVFNTFDFEMCFAPQRRALFQHLNFQNCSEPLSF